MLFTKNILLGALALASSVAAQGQVAFTSSFGSVAAGETVPITYSGGDGTPVEISLRQGEASNLGAPVVLTSSATGGTYSWSVDSSLASGSDYALQIKQGSAVNYSPQFALTGGSGTAATPSNSANVSSAISSAISSASESVSASVNATATASNATVTSATLSSTETATETEATTTDDSASATETPSDSDSGSASSAPSATPSSDAVALGISSPLALVLCAIAAMVYLN